MAARPPRSQPAVQTRQRLLVAAETLVVREGVLALSVRRIASEAAVNSALIRYYFEDVAGLLRELARLNAIQIRDARDALLDALETRPVPDFVSAVDALVLPLWVPAAMSGERRAIIVLDEIYARGDRAVHEEIWAQFASGVKRVSLALARSLGRVEDAALAWRIRFVTAAALDIPPRSARSDEHPRSPIYGLDTAAERLAEFRRFAQQALREI